MATHTFSTKDTYTFPPMTGTQLAFPGVIGTPAPTITGFLPISGARGSTVVLTGTHLTGATAVSINNAAVGSFVVDSATQLTAVLSNAQTTGLVRVTTPGGTAVSSAPFTVTTAVPAPTIASLTPSLAAVGDSIIINGTNLSNATSVKFGTIVATVTSNTATKIQVTVPVGATTSLVTVTTAGGTATKQFTLSGPVGAPVPNILFTGNSIIQATDGASPYTTLRNLVPSAWTMANEAISGQGISTMISYIATQVDPHYKPGASHNILIFQEGTNESANYNTKVQQYTQLLRARGWQVVLHTIPPRTDGLVPNFLNIAQSLNGVFRDNPSPYCDVLVDLSRNTKVGRFGDADNLSDPQHSSNNPTYYKTDKCHWMIPTGIIVGYMDYDAVNLLVNGIAMPDPANYPPNIPLPGQQVTFTGLHLVVEADGGVRPIDDQQANFVPVAKSVEAIAAGTGFCGAFQWQVDKDGGFTGVGAAGQAAAIQSVDNGFVNGVLVVHKSGQNSVGVAYTDTFRLELYDDRTLFIKNGNVEYSDLTPPLFPMQLYFASTGGSYGGIYNVRVEGNIV